MWYSIDWSEMVTVRLNLNTLTKEGTAAHCAIVLPSSKVVDLGVCKIRRKAQGDGFEELRLENIESGLRFDFIRTVK